MNALKLIFFYEHNLCFPMGAVWASLLIYGCGNVLYTCKYVKATAVKFIGQPDPHTWLDKLFVMANRDMGMRKKTSQVKSHFHVSMWL